MAIFWKIVNKVIRESDVLLVVLDSRFVEETRNMEVEDRIKSFGKPIIYVITKSDLIGRKKADAWRKKLRPVVFTSPREHHGSKRLKEMIVKVADEACPEIEDISVGVLGYPNIGKSSIINMLKGKKSAPVSSLSGHTKHLQKIRATKNIILYDTPGVIPFMEKDEKKHAMIGSIDHTKVKDPDLAARELIKKFPEKIKAFYGIKKLGRSDMAIVAIALKKGILMKGGKPDIMRASRMILKDFQKKKMFKK